MPRTTTTLPNLHKSEEVAAMLGITDRALRQWRSEGKGPRHLKIGAMVRYDEAEVVAWLDTKRATA